MNGTSLSYHEMEKCQRKNQDIENIFLLIHNMLCLKGKKSSLSAAFSLSKKSFRQAEASFCNFKKLQKLIDLTRMAQATLSCRFAAIHLVTPLLGFFRNYLPSRIRTLFVFFDTLKASQKAPHSGAFSFCSEGHLFLEWIPSKCKIATIFFTFFLRNERVLAPF